MADIKITVIDREGVQKEQEVPTEFGFNLMETLKALEYPIEATCGGMALCATCQCYILSDHTLRERSEDEEDMLDQAFFVEDNSRLTCQIPVTEDLDGLVVQIAPVSDEN